MVCCSFVPWSLDQQVEILNAATGWSYSIHEVYELGQRIATLGRIFNMREGMTAADDVMPKRMFEPTPTGGLKDGGIDKTQMDAAVKTFYGMMGWDEVTGVPTNGQTRLHLPGEGAVDGQQVGNLHPIGVRGWRSTRRCSRSRIGIDVEEGGCVCARRCIGSRTPARTADTRDRRRALSCGPAPRRRKVWRPDVHPDGSSRSDCRRPDLPSHVLLLPETPTRDRCDAGRHAQFHVDNGITDRHWLHGSHHEFHDPRLPYADRYP